MDEFVNWDNAASGDHPLFPEGNDLTTTDPSLSMDLALENVNDDEFGFFALQRFNHDHALPAITNVDTQFATLPADVDDHCLDTPLLPCGNCASAGYQCKTIREGRHTGFCTSCVALGFQCSFSDTVPAPAFSEPASFQQPSWAARLEEQACPNAPVDSEPEKTANPFGQPAQPSSADAPPPLVAPKPMNPSLGQQSSTPVGKVGARLSRESIRVLRQWLSTHSRHPYPSDEEKDMLQRQTGLTKTQITNWLANARRRNKIHPPRSTSPHVGSSFPMDIPARKGTPALEPNLSLQRWVDSPPENEPASAIAIARAVTESAGSSSEQASPFSSNVYTDDGSGRSLHESSASSVGTSHSSVHSNSSVWSHASTRNSFSSIGSFSRNRRRRRRRNRPKHAEEKTSLAPQLKTYQCTFCTETFKTKHDWGRHEKSLHLSLERWVCSNNGPRIMKADINKMACVFCGEPEPSDDHIESHNYSACFEKPVAAKTFYRKDHLNQHLKLVHNVKFADWSMKHWKVATPSIRSRCGFCDMVMDSWTIRQDHLAEHFKMGFGMEDWKGDWGFERPVLALVENSIPPYLIHSERYSPLPFEASGSSPESPRNAYELIKIELDYFARNKTSQDLVDEDLQLEACRIVFASEVLCLQGVGSTISWLRDLVMSSEAISHQAQFGPVRSQAENRLAILKINGKDNLFEACPMERELHEFVKTKVLLGLTAMDDELQEEACCIVGKMEEVSTHPSEFVANWLIRLIKSSTEWLAPFRQRAHIPRSEDIRDVYQRSTDKSKIDSTVHNYSRLEVELGEYLGSERSQGIEPTDEDLQRQARIIIFELEDGWNQTAADNPAWLAAFRQRHTRGAQDGASATITQASRPSPPLQLAPSGFSPIPDSQDGGSEVIRGVVPPYTKSGRLFLNDANCYRRLAWELKRWVASVISPNNPNQHVPSDEELQHQARWIIYDDDDPWDRTAADNAEWLQRFKVDAGISKDGPGLPDVDCWDVKQGGLGLAPPYAVLHNGLPDPRAGGSRAASGRPADAALEASPEKVSRYVKTTSQRYPRPARVFCSQELEDGLAGLVRHKAGCGIFPTDEELWARGRVVLGMERTAAEEPVLLEKFKKMMEEEVGVSSRSTSEQGVSQAGTGPETGAQAGTGLGMSGLGMAVMGGGAGDMPMAGLGAMGDMTGLDMGMDPLGDMDDALMQDLNFDFVFDAQDATMGPGGAMTG